MIPMMIPRRARKNECSATFTGEKKKDAMYFSDIALHINLLTWSRLDIRVKISYFSIHY